MFGSIFSLDGPFHKYGTILFDLVMLNIFWLFISGLSFGLLSGPATVALYRSVNHAIINQSGTPSREFFLTFKNKFKVSFLSSLIILFMSVTCVLSLIWSNNGVMPSWMYPLYFAILLYIVLILPYGIGLIVESDLRLRDIFKYSILLAIKHLPYTFLVLLISVAGIALLAFQPFTILFVAGLVALGQSYFVSNKVYSRYDLNALNK